MIAGCPLRYKNRHGQAKGSGAKPAAINKADDVKLDGAEQQEPYAKNQGVKLVDILQVQPLRQAFSHSQAEIRRGQQQSRKKAKQQNAAGNNQGFKGVFHQQVPH